MYTPKQDTLVIQFTVNHTVAAKNYLPNALAMIKLSCS